MTDLAALTLLTVTEVAELIGVKPKTVRRWIAQGELPVVRLNARMLRVRALDVERLIAAHLDTSSTAGTAVGAGPRFAAGTRWWGVR